MAHEQPWPPEKERAFKEVLYRFMGEVHATKAALYLVSSNQDWSLATQYGFGRRDRLAETFAGDHPLVRMVRAFGQDPRFYNDPSEVGEVAGYLAEAGTTRLMLVPIMGRSGHIGFVDVRDKGGQRAFAPQDLALARSIASGLSRLVEEAVAVEDNRRAEPEEPKADPDLPIEIPTDPGEEPRALLDEAGFDEINAAAVDGLADPRVMAIAVSVASRLSGAMLIHQRDGSTIIDRDTVLKHQLEAMTKASAPAPGPDKWKTEVRRMSWNCDRRPVILSSRARSWSRSSAAPWRFR